MNQALSLATCLGLFTLAGCQTDDAGGGASAATPPVDISGIVQACANRMASEINVPVMDISATSNRINRDGTVTTTLIALRGDQATCIADRNDNVLSINYF